MQDADLEYLLEVVGHTISSHVMCRAHLSAGTGRNEEPLTADVRDLFDYFDVCNLYLNCVGSQSSMTITVTDLHRAAETKTGADFVIAMNGTDSDGNAQRTIKKIVGVQAKRQDYRSSPLKYKRSENHGLQAKKMEARYGSKSAFFAFYHDEQVLPPPNPVPRRLNPPTMYYAKASCGDQMFFCHHPDMRIPRTFIEPSLYRKLRLMQKAKGSGTITELPWDYEWGIVLHDVAIVRDPSGNYVDVNDTSLVTLPSVGTVMGKGLSLPRFLVEMAECTVGDILTDAEYAQALVSLRSLQPSEEERPEFIVEIEFASGSKNVTKRERRRKELD